MYKNLTVASVLGMLAVILGAFGAHALKSKLAIEEMQSFETAVRYQLFHVLVLLFLNGFQGFSLKQKKVLTVLFTLGIVLFSGSIYAIYLLKIPSKLIWFVTPIGGVTLIVAWFLMMKYFIKKNLLKAIVDKN